MRLYDKAADSQLFHSGIRDCVLIDVQNVHEYYKIHGDPDLTKMEGMGAAFTPPFNHTWLEYSYPISVTGGSKIPSRVALWIESSDSETGAVVDCIVVLGWDNRFIEVGSFSYACDMEGNFTREARWTPIDKVEQLLGSEWPESIIHHAISISFLTLSFMHCKNVTLEDAPFIGPRQQRRALERHGIKQAKFKTLVIEPMKQILKTEGGIETHGLKKALHICRGHFATYSEDRPLFGKYSGTFWKPAHVRGNADNGTVYKDYKVNAPKE